MIRHEVDAWDTERQKKREKMEAIYQFSDGKVVKEDQIKQLLETAIRPGETVAIEGDNQKQAVQLSKGLATVDPKKVNGLHIVMSCTQMQEHLDIFELGIAEKLDFSYAGNAAKRLPEMIEAGTVKVGAIHTYLEMFSRMFTDLIPNVCLCVAEEADKDGNLYTGPNTEETPTIVEATAFKSGVVIVQVNKLVDKVTRIDIPGEWVDVVVPTEEPCVIEPIMTRDPQYIKDVHVLQGMMAIKGIYAKHLVTRMNHGIGFNTAAIELLLPTYGEELGLKGKICTNWVSNPIPAMIPAIETGWVKSVVAFGSELGMEDYVRERSDVFFTGADGSLRSNRCYAQMAGMYGIDMFTGSTLQMDADGNSSTVTKGRITGFGGAPNMGSNPHGRRHSSPAWNSMITNPSDPMAKGNKLVTQIVRTQTKAGPTFVEQLDAVEVGKQAGFDEPPVMIYGEDLTHLITEVGLGYVYMGETPEERRKIIAAVAGDTPVGHTITTKEINELRAAGKVAFPEDLGIDPSEATRERLAAKNMKEITDWSDGLYKAPPKFKNW
ncbi:malonate decarboxylase subunit alpha [Mediterraneibacter butyricigenes]|uniref:Malonate decarboxylase subunit alpha n=1 Tax=Mediterraneibacter butyricigenes TaxID=2316025 RepID=A0A391P3K4_9FIRM|nr:malonate decarboxylase subunit alpha [Mediterraneibacter butyricigenes]RGO24226.1 malonate decarboxylase subunit alpha [Dorea sp. OM02-2LB]RGV98642.1 malonate decarboxylase subunit alpha [Ruminococcus sp. AF14-10]GCA68165.1 malonate decarboxylase subunit alpha [Mediterraneibacter butyricigenes]